MELLHTVSIVILFILLGHFFFINIIELPKRHLVTVPEKLAIQENTVPSALNIMESGEQAQAQYKGGLGVANPPTDHLIQQAVYDPKSQYKIAASNQDVSDKEADFGTEQTNVSQFFSSNPNAFMNDERHNAYVPDTQNWDEKGDAMYQKQVNTKRTQIQAHNLDQFQTNLTV